jgi:hypothetical protein
MADVPPPPKVLRIARRRQYTTQVAVLPSLDAVQKFYSDNNLSLRGNGLVLNWLIGWLINWLVG